jgi:hypothetical protein
VGSHLQNEDVLQRRSNVWLVARMVYAEQRMAQLPHNLLPLDLLQQYVAFLVGWHPSIE